MKTINLFLICIILCSAFDGYAQQQKSKDDILLEKIHAAYNRIPSGLGKDELLQKTNDAEKEAKQVMDSLSGKEVKQKAKLLCYNGILWSLVYKLLK